MENSSSHAPVAWHDFLDRMRHPSASDFVKSIKNFIISFSNKAPDPEKDGAAVQEFLTNMEAAFRVHKLWAGCSEEELESAGEGLEKYVMTKLFNRTFASLPEDVQRDEELFLQIALLEQFVRPENLDIKPAFQNATTWLLAQKELQKINSYKAPRDKLMCIFSCCKVINDLLLNASEENPPGADDFLSVLIYLTIKANPSQLHSNLLYIQQYRLKSRLVSEVAYYFTNLLSAETFIWNIDAKSLSMDEVEFQNKIESARAHLLGLSTNTESIKSQTDHDLNEQTIYTAKEIEAYAFIREQGQDQFITNVPSISNLSSISNLEEEATKNLKDDQFSTYLQEFPYLYANAGDLTVEDVHKLLDCYKRLVIKHVTCSKGNFNTSKESEDG